MYLDIDQPQETSIFECSLIGKLSKYQPLPYIFLFKIIMEFDAPFLTVGGGRFGRDKRLKSAKNIAYKHGIEKLGYKYVRDFLVEPEPNSSANDTKTHSGSAFGISGLSLPHMTKDQAMNPALLRTSRSAPATIGATKGEGLTGTEPQSSLENQQQKPTKRVGGPESYYYTPHAPQENAKINCRRCYRVLTYIKDGNRNVLVDIGDGSRVKDFGDRITKNMIVYDSQLGAESEKFGLNQFRGSAGALPRVFVAFDCWGKSIKRNGGGCSSFLFEYAKYIGIVKCLDPTYPNSKKQTPVPNPPQYFPKRDFFPPPRAQSTRDIRVNRKIYV